MLRFGWLIYRIFKVMSFTSSQPNYSLESVVERICNFRQITPVDRDLLTQALTRQDYFSHRERHSIDRVFEGIRQGWIWIAD